MTGMGLAKRSNVMTGMGLVVRGIGTAYLSTEMAQLCPVQQWNCVAFLGEVTVMHYDEMPDTAPALQSNECVAWKRLSRLTFRKVEKRQSGVENCLAWKRQSELPIRLAWQWQSEVPNRLVMKRQSKVLDCLAMKWQSEVEGCKALQRHCKAMTGQSQRRHCIG